MIDSFNISKDASGNTIYTHNNQALPRDEYYKRMEEHKVQMQNFKDKIDRGMSEFKSSTTLDFDDDPEFSAMREKSRAMQGSKMPMKKASGGAINLSNCKVNTAKKNKSGANW